MRVLVVALAALSAVVAVPLEQEQEHQRQLFEEFKAEYGKKYESGSEETHRLDVFAESLRRIQEHNARLAAGLETYEMGLTEFADMTDEEFEQFLEGSGPPPDLDMLDLDLDLLPTPNLTTGALPDKLDWREKKAVNPARKQGGCGGCWAFSAVATLESVNFVKTGELLQLSVQNLLDCSRDQGNFGCDGGFAWKGLSYVKVAGIEREADYPYEEADGKCRFDPAKSVLQTRGYAKAGNTNEAVQAALLQVGPLSISVDAKEFKYYKSGVMVPKQPFKKINHGINLDGYGTDDGVDYWLIRNTWGPTWGEKGYIRVLRGADKIGLLQKAVYPLL